MADTIVRVYDEETRVIVEGSALVRPLVDASAASADAALAAAADAAIHRTGAESAAESIDDVRTATLIRPILPVGWFDPTNYPEGAWYRNDFSVKFWCNGLRVFTMMPVSAIGFNSGWLDPSNITMADDSGVLHQAVSLDNVCDPCLQFGVTVTTLHVSPLGNDTTGNGSIGTPYRTEAKARTVANATPGTYDIVIHCTGDFIGTETFAIGTYTISQKIRYRFVNDGTGPGFWSPSMRETYTTGLFAFVDLGDGFYQVTAANGSISTNAKTTAWVYDPSVLDSDGKPGASRFVSGTYANGAAAKAAIIAALGSSIPGFNYNATSGLVFKLASGASPVPGRNFLYTELSGVILWQLDEGARLCVDGFKLAASLGRTVSNGHFITRPSSLTLGPSAPNVVHDNITVFRNNVSLGGDGTAFAHQSGFRVVCVGNTDYDAWLDAVNAHTNYNFGTNSNSPDEGLYDHMFVDRHKSFNHCGGDGRNPAQSPGTNTSANGPTAHERERMTVINSIFRGSNGANAAIVTGAHLFSFGNMYSGVKTVEPADQVFSAAFNASDISAALVERATIFSAYDSASVPGDATGRSVVFYAGPFGDIAFLGFNGVVTKVTLGEVKLSANATDGNSFTAGDQTYTYRNAPAGPFDIQIGATRQITTTNAISAVNANASGTTDLWARATADTSTTALRKQLMFGQVLTMAAVGAAVTVNSTSPTITELSGYGGPQGPAGPPVSDGSKGDVTVSASGSLWTIAVDAITNAKLSNMPQATFKGRAAAAGTGDPTDLTPAQAKAALAITAADIVSGLGYFATGTDAANLTGTVAVARLPQFAGGDVTTAGVGSVSLSIANGVVTYAKMQNVSALRLLGNPTGSPAAPSELSLGANLTFSGTTLTVTAAGSDRQVQYNNGAALGGAGGVDIDADGDLRLDAASGTTAPGADQMKIAPQKLAAGGGRVWPRWRGEDGTYITPQSHLGRNSIAWVQSIGSSATNPVFNGMTALNQLGTLASRAVASTNRATRARRTGYVTTSAAAGLTCGFYNAAPNNQYSVGGASGAGFLAVFRFVPSDPATVAGAHMFVGMTSQTASPTAATNPNTFTNSIGLAQCNGSANLQIVYGGSAAQTVIDLGANFPAGGLSTDLYELILYARPDDATKVAYRVERINTSDVASGVLTGVAGTALPANTTFMGPRMYRSNNATALAAGFDLVTLEIESDL